MGAQQAVGKEPSELEVILARLDSAGQKLDRHLSEIREGLSRVIPYSEPEPMPVKSERSDIPLVKADHHVALITEKLNQLDKLANLSELIRNHVNKIG